MDSPEYYQTILSCMNEQVYVRDLDMNILYINPAAEKLTGWTLKESLGKKCYQVFGDESLECRNVCPVEKSITEKNNILHHEGELKNRNGDIRQMRVSISTIQEEDNISGAIVVMQDITDFKALEESHLKAIIKTEIMQESFKESEQRFKNLFQQSNDAIIVHQGGQIIDVNESACELLGYGHYQLIKMSIPDILAESRKEGFDKRLKNTLDKRSILFESQWIRADSTTVDVEVSSRVINKGKKIVQAIARDITDRKHAEKALRESESNFRTFFNNIDNLLFILDEQGRIQEVNQTVIDRLGYSLDELENQPVLVVHPEERRDEAGQIITEMLQGKQDFCHVPLITKKGDLIPVETYVSEGVWNGKPALYGISKDISLLKISEEKFSKAFHSNPAIAGISDLETGEYIEVNRIFYDKLGFSPKEVIGKRASEVIKMDLEFRENALHKFKSRGYIKNEETIIYAKNGSQLNVLLSAEFIELAGKKYNYTTAIDITDRKRAEEALQESKELFEKIFNSQLDALLILNANIPPEIIDCNPAATEVFGYTREEMLGCTTTFLHSSEDMLKKFQENLYPAIEEHGFCNFSDFEMKRKNGTVFPTEHSVIPLYGSKAERIGWVSLIRDITERKQTEKVLRESEERLRRVVENMPVMMDALDEANKIIAWNRECERVTGYSAEEMIGNSHSLEILYPDDEYREQMIAELLELGLDFRDKEYTLTCKDGSKKTVSWSNVSGRLQIPGWHTWGIGLDVTERKKAEKQIARSLKEKEVLLREIHHRVKNNMQAIVSLLRMHSRKTEDIRLKQIFGDCRDRINAMSLIHEALYQSEDLARIDFEAYLKKLCRNLNQVYAASSKGIDITVEHCDVKLNMDQSIAVGMVISELISNAFKHAFPTSNGGGSVLIRLSALEGREIELAVLDNGKGLPANIDIMNSPSLGLQLVSATITRELGGTIKAERDKGTRFIIRFKIKGE